MIELPIIAMKLQGYGDEYIQLQINEVYGFPNEIAYGGGYGASGILSIKVGSYNVHSNHYFTTGELYEFLCQLQKCYDSVSGKAVFNNTEQNLNLKLRFDKTGKVLVSGEFQAQLDVSNRLQFEMVTDQTAIFEVLVALKKVNRIFGNSKGIK